MSKDKIITGETTPPDFRQRFKSKLKEYIRKKMSEISASGAIGGGDGSAGPIKTPHAFGNIEPSNVLKSMPGGKLVKSDVSKNEASKKDDSKKDDSKKDAPKKDAPKKDAPKKDAPAEYEPIVKTVKPELDPEIRLKKMVAIKNALASAEGELDVLYKSRRNDLDAKKRTSSTK